MATSTVELAATMGLIPSEVELIVSFMGREPNYTELGMFAVMWSEHCGYKYSRPVLSYFKRYKEAMEGAGLENAGIVPLGDGLGVAFKVESHNHPSAVEPYQGAATGVGGILRDIFTMGARPIACLNSLRFGPLEEGPQTSPEVAKRNRYLFDHVVAGIAGYGNCVGVPTVAGEVAFHPRFSGNPLVNAMAVGILEVSEMTTAAAGGVGNPVLYLGSATGKDGIHGATFASEELGEDSEEKRPNVQIGDPFAEKLLIDATLEALQTGAIHSIQDMGAAGLTCSTIEMSAKGSVGMEIDLDRVPMREADMTAYELMLSESQERMLCVAHRGREQEVIDVFEKWGIHAVVIGTVSDTGRVRVYRHGRLEADVDPKHLADHCPTYHSPSAEPAYAAAAREFSVDAVPVADLRSSLETLLSHPNLASKRWVFQQFDQQVQTQTRVLAGAADAAVLAPRGTKKGLAVKIDGNGLWTYLEPYVGGTLAVVEAARNVACTGALPAGVTDGLNFGSPQQPHVYWQFDRAVKGIADAAEALGTPVVSGNVSFYNQSDLGEILPTPMIGMVGILSDATKAIGMAPRPGDELAAVVVPLNTLPQQGLGASQYLSAVHSIEDGIPVMPNLEGEKALQHWLVDSVEQERLHAAHDVSEGGIAVTLAEMAIAGGVGVRADLGALATDGVERQDALCFGERPGVVVVAYAADGRESLSRSAEASGLSFLVLGEVENSTVVVQIHGITLVELPLQIVRELHEGGIPTRVAGE